jgi:hypothetical protein
MTKVGLRRGEMAKGERRKAGGSQQIRARACRGVSLSAWEFTTAWTSATTVVLPPPISIVCDPAVHLNCPALCIGSLHPGDFHHPPFPRQTCLPCAVRLTPP